MSGDAPRTTGLRVQPPVVAKEKRLAALLAERGRGAGDRRLAEVVADAQLLGSLELAGVRASWEEVRASRASPGEAPAEVVALRRARAAVPADAPLTVEAIRAWHAALAGPVGFRRVERLRADAPPAPPELIESQLETLQEWITAAGVRDLRPEQAAGLAYARIVEVLPFEDGNGRVARLAASHLMVQAGLRPPILAGGDGPYLLACLRAAFRLDTEPLVSLLAEASARALDVMTQALERGEA
jgi:hypothetical protein